MRAQIERLVRWGVTLLAMTAVGGGCVEPPQPIAVIHEPLRVCAAGETVDGIDVSHHQGTIDWDRVAADGIEYAFIRVSDGAYLDRNFETNWAEARRVGVLRGAYQFFRPGRDGREQADILLDRMGELEPDDLPPVLDVEDDDGYSATTIQNGVRAWMDRVMEVTGRVPIIYTGYYFWRDEVGDSAEWSDHPLWIAQYGRECPTIPDVWATWHFWQTSERGRVDGISTNVDTNLFNGSLDDLMSFTLAEPVCGDGRCTGDETHEVCPGDCPICEPIPPEGRAIDETELCFVPEGPERYWRREADGWGGALRWTYATSSDAEVIAASWMLDFDEAGTYLVEVYTDGDWAGSVEADYRIHHAGRDSVVEVDQTAVDGWTVLGEVEFAAGGDQWIRLGDNTGESGGLRRRVVYDAIRLSRADEPDEPDMPDEPEPPYESWIGERCRDDADCLTGQCLTESMGYPGGMCTEPCTRYCPDADGHPMTFCVAIEGEGYCFSRRDTSFFDPTGCREGYHAETLPRHNQRSVRRDVCVPNLAADGEGTVENPEPEGVDVWEPFLPDAMTGDALDGDDGDLVELGEATTVTGGCSAAGAGATAPAWVALLCGLVALALRRR